MDEQTKDTTEGVSGTTENVVTTPSQDTPTPTPTTEAATVSQSPTSQEGSTKLPYGTIIGVLIACIAFGIGYVFLFNDGVFPFMSDTPEESSEDTISIAPDQVIARVNGSDVTGAAYMMQIAQMTQSFGVSDINALEPNLRYQIQQQALDAVVNTALVVHAAGVEGVMVTPEEVDAEYDTLIAAVGGEAVAQERLAAMGVTAAQFKANLKSDIAIKGYLEVTAGEDVLSVTDEEVQSFYTEAVGEAEGAPPLEAVRFQIEEQLRFQKIQEALGAALVGLRENATIEILI